MLEKTSRAMKIIGCDFHTRHQQIAIMDDGRVAGPFVLFLDDER
jgi:hypothetical protein